MLTKKLETHVTSSSAFIFDSQDLFSLFVSHFEGLCLQNYFPKQGTWIQSRGIEITFTGQCFTKIVK